MSNTPQADTFVSVPDSLLASTQDILASISRRIKKQHDDIVALLDQNSDLMLAVLERDRQIRDQDREIGTLRALVERLQPLEKAA